MVAPIQPIDCVIISPVSIQYPMGYKRVEQIIKKIYEEERKNSKKRSRKEIEESWEQFRRRQKEDNAEL